MLTQNFSKDHLSVICDYMKIIITFVLTKILMHSYFYSSLQFILLSFHFSNSVSAEL